MSKRKVHIERLQIRMRGVSEAAARAAVGGIGQELLGQLSELEGGKRNVQIGHIDSGTTTVNSRKPAAELRNQIAKQVASSIKTKVKQR